MCRECDNRLLMARQLGAVVSAIMICSAMLGNNAIVNNNFYNSDENVCNAGKGGKSNNRNMFYSNVYFYITAIILHVIIKHGSMKCIEGEGFPTHRDPFNKGRLICIFSVDFPESLSEGNAKKIREALPKVPQPTIPNPSEEVKLVEFDGEGQWKGGVEEEENGNEDQQGGHGQGFYSQQEFQGGPQAQCAQQ